MVVSHEASRTGAPRIAIEVINALKKLDVECVAVVRWPGPLFAAIQAAADRTRLEPLRRLRVGLRRFRQSRKLAIAAEERVARRVLTWERPDLVWLNTVKSACYVRSALELDCKVVLHSHELGALAQGTLARYRLGDLYERVHLVACSQAAANELHMAAGGGLVTVIPEALDINRVRLSATLPSTHHGLGRGATVVACGTADQRKGTDLWIEVARQVWAVMGDRCPRFEWIGLDEGGRFETLARESHLDDKVEFIGAVENPYPMIAAATVVTVPSRQDAFPLVVLEAMALRKPVVAFDIGGIREQLDDTGMLVSPGDVAAMAAAVVGLLGDDQSRRSLGDAAALRVEELFEIGTFRRSVAELVTEELGRP
ncbi:MAG: glycosyltransferase [Acidimicrobiales bacterium]